MTQQTKLKLGKSWEEQQADHAKIRALILQRVTKYPGMTCSQIQQDFLSTYRFLPRIDNRLRELTNDPKFPKYLRSQQQTDGLLHYYPNEEIPL